MWLWLLIPGSLHQFAHKREVLGGIDQLAVVIEGDQLQRCRIPQCLTRHMIGVDGEPAQLPVGLPVDPR
ncbi:MAG: hypothetical protein GWO88_00875, partial [Planctomycetia bacterium]|nr:hypothetical protein [Planctomycetia bacterium]